MNTVLVISLLASFVVIAALGLGAGLFVARSRAEGESASLDGVVERVVSVAGESFDSRLQTGTAELEHRRQAIDDHLEGVVKSLAEKIDSVDKLVAEGSVFQCAGGLMVENPLVQPHVLRMEGTMDSIMGLCTATLKKLLEEAVAARLRRRPA